jgi:hypothetical protein
VPFTIVRESILPERDIVQLTQIFKQRIAWLRDHDLIADIAKEFEEK